MVHPRYAPLYSAERVENLLGRKMYPSFPYRPDNAADIRNVSRSFAFRPELRLGVLYNRLNSQALVARVTSHPRYQEFAPFFLFNLLQCSWPKGAERAQQSWTTRASSALGIKAKTLAGGGLEYRQNWALFDLTLNDVDIRYSYYHPGYANQDASGKVMEVGYIGRYFNSYFDGSATIDELVAGALYSELAANQLPQLHGVTQPWGLVAKYKHLADRYKYDQNFFMQMDRLGKWIHIPFPKQLAAVHHREAFTAAFAEQHQKLCSALANILR